MTADNVSRYVVPRRWVHYDLPAVFHLLVEAKTGGGVLNQMPYLPQWIEEAHAEQLRLEAAGTSRIEGAQFTQREQDEALAVTLTATTRLTRSQRQLRAADATYRWLRSRPAEQPVSAEFIRKIHRRIVTGCDDDHCEPDRTRPDAWNVTFGTPRCRGAEGGRECSEAFEGLAAAIAGEFQRHDRLIQAIAAHYHIGAMHPFGDGNGRTARALEAFMLRRAGVNDVIMVSLSNYYYEHKDEYLTALYETRENGHDLTPFLKFALPAVAERCNVVAESIATNHHRVLFREFARSLFGKLRSPRRRVLAQRQLQILEILLEVGPSTGYELGQRVRGLYKDLKHPRRAATRDLIGLLEISAVAIADKYISANLDWPRESSESELLERYENLPSAVSAAHPAMAQVSQLFGRRGMR